MTEIICFGNTCCGKKGPCGTFTVHTASTLGKTDADELVLLRRRKTSRPGGRSATRADECPGENSGGHTGLARRNGQLEAVSGRRIHPAPSPPPPSTPTFFPPPHPS